jgi:hypothetical protein
MVTVYLTCFVLGVVLSLLAAFGGLGRLHFGHLRIGPLHVGHTHAGHVKPGGSHLSALNGFTLPAFLGWFGGAGYLLSRYSSMAGALVLLVAIASGMVAAGVLYAALFKLLLPCERELTEEETRMEGVVARVSGAIRAEGGTGEILFSQADARRSAAARSEGGEPIAKGTEVVVLRYAHGIAYVKELGVSCELSVLRCK